MYTIKLHDVVVKSGFESEDKALMWIEYNLTASGLINVYYSHSWQAVSADELVITADEQQAMHTLSSHPRCPTCGITTFTILHSVSDLWIGMYTCGEHTMGYMHGGTKVEHCPYCKGSEETTTGDTCPYCKALWS